MQKKRNRTQIANIKNERGDITIDHMDINKKIKEYCEQLYEHKLDNIDESSQFFERHNLPKFMQEEIDNVNKLIPMKEIDSIIENLPQYWAQMHSLANSTKHLNGINSLSSLPEDRNKRNTS